MAHCPYCNSVNIADHPDNFYARTCLDCSGVWNKNRTQ